MADWDAARYHRVSDPQLAWGRKVLARLAPRPGERILDVGCGTGRLTTEIASTPGIVVIGLDRSRAMVSEAAHRGQTPDAALHRPAYVLGDGAALPFAGAFDGIFSAATFHWIHDHDRLFHSIHAALKPGGRIVAQCGGAGNLQRLHDRTVVLMTAPRYAPFFADWSDPWNFAGPDDTTRRLEAAGFEAIAVSLEPAPTRLADAHAFSEFISCVCVRHHVDRLPPDERGPFVDALAEQAALDESPYTLDYWRLNISARKGRA